MPAQFHSPSHNCELISDVKFAVFSHVLETCTSLRVVSRDVLRYRHTVEQRRTSLWHLYGALGAVFAVRRPFVALSERPSRSSLILQYSLQ